jgi:hypothetical protein
VNVHNGTLLILSIDISFRAVSNHILLEKVTFDVIIARFPFGASKIITAHF